MNKIQLLDCTLRDGGYVNNWNFKENNIKQIIGNLSSAGIEMIECGFLSETKPYLKYQSHHIDDSTVISEISELCRNRKVLILAPGKSLLTYRDEIENFITENDPVIFSINHIPKFSKFDRVFISNLKRFRSLDDAINLIKDKLICTSNISTENTIHVVNYSDYLNSNDTITDNSGLMLINVLIKSGVKSLTLAGYDGFGYVDRGNYFDENMANNVAAQHQNDTNWAIIDYFAKIRRNIDITFITPTIYDNN